VVQPVALISFRGTSLDSATTALLADPRVAGVTLFRSLNIESAPQTRGLTDALVRATGRRILIAADQEGGQLLGAGADTTPFAGNMALGATGDPDLARRVAAAIGRELAALGINLNYAPVADIATRADNPSLGIRSFGEGPAEVAAMVAATVEGLQSVGVAATIKHFPGKGEAAVDPHHQLPVLGLTRGRLEEVEFAPFRAGIAAGARLLMVGHYALPAITGDATTPTSASRAVLSSLIRGELGFGGLIVTDALDMAGFSGVSDLDPLRAGADLLLYGPAQAGQLPPALDGDEGRLRELHDWSLSFPTPSLEVVGCREHQLLATELARRSVTLVRDQEPILPYRPGGEDRILVVMVRPINLTPADTSAEVEPGLAEAIRRRHPATSEIIIEHRPSLNQLEGVANAATDHDLVVVGTYQAGEAQAGLVHRLLESGIRVVTVALRTPYDLALYPEAPTHLATYGVLPPSMEALAAGLFGEIELVGRLPVSIPGLASRGHRTG
jgi:beta-N-acetylhexosaminidase